MENMPDDDYDVVCDSILECKEMGKFLKKLRTYNLSKDLIKDVLSFKFCPWCGNIVDMKKKTSSSLQ